MSSIADGPEDSKYIGKADIREGLFNAGDIGLIECVQVSFERITSLRGILLDLDPGLYRVSPLLP